MIVDYEPEHAVQILTENGDQEEVWFEQAKTIAEHPGGVTLLIDQQPILCTGAIEMWDKCAEAWMIVSTKISENPISIARKVKRGMLLHFEKKNFVRVQANVRADWPVALRFAEFCEFQREGYMKKFGPEGADYVRFAWVQ